MDLKQKVKSFLCHRAKVDIADVNNEDGFSRRVMKPYW